MNIQEAVSLREDDILVDKYKIIRLLGSGWEGKVYLVSELGTGIERAAKLFYPSRNKRNISSRRFARKLHKLRNLPKLIQYHSQEQLTVSDKKVTVLISEYIEGELLSSFIRRQPGGKLSELQAALLLYELTKGVEAIHLSGDYHGDLHDDNVMVCRHGLGFDVKFVDFFYQGRVEKARREDDIVELIRIFFESLGGRKRYHRFSETARYICGGMRSDLILSRFKSATHLKSYLEHMSWD